MKRRKEKDEFKAINNEIEKEGGQSYSTRTPSQLVSISFFSPILQSTGYPSGLRHSPISTVPEYEEKVSVLVARRSVVRRAWEGFCHRRKRSKEAVDEEKRKKQLEAAKMSRDPPFPIVRFLVGV